MALPRSVVPFDSGEPAGPTAPMPSEAELRALIEELKNTNPGALAKRQPKRKERIPGLQAALAKASPAAGGAAPSRPSGAPPARAGGERVPGLQAMVSKVSATPQGTRIPGLGFVKDPEPDAELADAPAPPPARSADPFSQAAKSMRPIGITSRQLAGATVAGAAAPLLGAAGVAGLPLALGSGAIGGIGGNAAMGGGGELGEVVPNAMMGAGLGLIPGAVGAGRSLARGAAGPGEALSSRVAAPGPATPPPRLQAPPIPDLTAGMRPPPRMGTSGLIQNQPVVGAPPPAAPPARPLTPVMPRNMASFPGTDPSLLGSGPKPFPSGETLNMRTPLAPPPTAAPQPQGAAVPQGFAGHFDRLLLDARAGRPAALAALGLIPPALGTAGAAAYNGLVGPGSAANGIPSYPLVEQIQPTPGAESRSEDRIPPIGVKALPGFQMRPPPPRKKKKAKK